MLNTPIGFSLIVSTIITLITYTTIRTKNKTEKEQKDKLNDMIIIFVISFMVVMFGKLCIGDSVMTTISSSPVVSRVTESKGGQCPF
jgi:hypothetical protein